MMRIILLFLTIQLTYSSYSQITTKEIPRDSLSENLLTNENGHQDAIGKPLIFSMDSLIEIKVDPLPMFINKLRQDSVHIYSHEKVFNFSGSEKILDKEARIIYKDDIVTKIVQNRLDIGYYADLKNAPYGGFINYSIKEIYGISLPLNIIGKYWTNNTDSKAYEFLVNYNILSNGYNKFPSNLLIAHTSLNYNSDILNFKQTRVILSKDWFGMAYDYGFSFNQFNSENFGSLLFGYSYRTIPYRSYWGNLGFHANINYNPRFILYNAGIYKEFYFKKFNPIMISAKYYNFNQFDGLMISFSFGLINTRQYCCSSWSPYYHNINVLK
jgi:hypothetical protein